MKTLFVFSMTVFVLLSSCAATQRAAANDPQKCERDPKCQDKSKANDCSTQCADDVGCVDRCRQINVETGSNSDR